MMVASGGRRIGPRAVAAAVAIALSVAATGCGDPSIAKDGTAIGDIKPLELPEFPKTLLDLTVQPEDAKETLTRTQDRTYFDAVSLYSLRQASGPQKDLVHATLQVSRFNDDARWKDEEFRAAILTNLGGSTPQRLQLGEDEINVTRGQQQSVAVWFRDRHMFILSTRQDFDRPRSLLRAVTQVKI